MSDFDFGCDSKDVAGESNIFLWPTEGRRTALVDADAIAYVVGYTSDMTEYLAAKRSGSFNEHRSWQSKKEHASFLLNKWVNNAGCDSAMLFMTSSKLDYERGGIREDQPFEANFREAIAETKTYKGQRIEEKPPYFQEIRNWLLSHHSAHLSTGREADDDISIEAWRRIKIFLDEGGELWSAWHKKMSNFVIVSKDKDLRMIPTWHCPPDKDLFWATPLGSLDPEYREKQVTDYEYWPCFGGKPVNLKHCKVPMMYGGKLTLKTKDEIRSPKHRWEMDYVWHDMSGPQDTYTRGAQKDKGKFKRVKVGMKPSSYMHKLSGTGLMFFYSQIITGDTVDNYSGLPDVGMTKAFAMLDGADSEQELVSRVRQAYENVYGDSWLERLTEQGRLAWMQTSEDDLWSVPSSNEQSYPL